jgi:hypothetical protein
MEVVWPLDEEAAVPLCVRTVDGGRQTEDVASWEVLVQPPVPHGAW